ncbi:hypothetical protein BT93_B1531 [Corymbia citriodora subsp. variegata]|nr:hypothetical protein BT93_B1531 [Corymbia citriodora subsp. variegata]
MEEAKGLVRHLILVKFKDGTPPAQIEQIIKNFANLVNLIEPLKSWHMGRDVSIENLHQGFTHVLETTFESIEGIAQYLPHLAHVEFSKQFVPQLEKVLVVNFKPTIVHKQNRIVLYSADVMLI